MGNFIVCVRTFSQTSGVTNIFPDIKPCKIFFSALYARIDIYWAYDIIFPSYFLASFFPPRNQYAGFFFFWNHPQKSLSKVKKSNNHLLSGQILMSIISKAFWNNRGQNPWGEGGIHFYLPSPGKNIRTYGDDMINFFALIWSPLSRAKREGSEASL